MGNFSALAYMRSMVSQMNWKEVHFAAIQDYVCYSKILSIMCSLHLIWTQMLILVQFLLYLFCCYPNTAVWNQISKNTIHSQLWNKFTANTMFGQFDFSSMKWFIVCIFKDKQSRKRINGIQERAQVRIEPWPQHRLSYGSGSTVSWRLLYHWMSLNSTKGLCPLHRDFSRKPMGNSRHA